MAFSTSLRSVAASSSRSILRFSTTPARYCSSSCSHTRTAAQQYTPRAMAAVNAPLAAAALAHTLRTQAAAAQQQVRGMKIRSAVRKYCDGCTVVRRKGYLYIICSKDPKHKQRQG